MEFGKNLQKITEKPSPIQESDLSLGFSIWPSTQGWKGRCRQSEPDESSLSVVKGMK